MATDKLLVIKPSCGCNRKWRGPKIWWGLFCYHFCVKFGPKMVRGGKEILIPSLCSRGSVLWKAAEINVRRDAVKRIIYSVTFKLMFQTIAIMLT